MPGEKFVLGSRGLGFWSLGLKGVGFRGLGVGVLVFLGFRAFGFGFVLMMIQRCFEACQGFTCYCAESR